MAKFAIIISIAITIKIRVIVITITFDKNDYTGEIFNKAKLFAY